ncbi:FbpB family small basic protein (plasmid) [Sutcliffiella horikoshii]|nr:FbpB family small basic protein [Sutcliffiella horikoshii]UAL49710.1 FbpB family small basic protein [Sutcliffiella horikoshii]
MKKKNLKQLLIANKDKILKDDKAIEKIHKKIDEKYLQLDK